MLNIFFFIACSSGSEKQPATTNSAPEVIAEKKKEKTFQSIEKIMPDSENVLAPSPMETQIAIEKAGLKTTLASLLPKRELSFEFKSKDEIAMRTGVLLSDTVLTIKDLPKEQLVTNMENIHEGLKLMGAGGGLLDTIQNLTSKTKADAISRDDLLKEIEEIVGMAIPEDGVGKDDRTGPLLQAGAWLSGINLVCEAILKESRIDAADRLLRQKHVATYYLRYSETDGQSKAPVTMLRTLQAALRSMESIADKKPITKEDIELVRTQTATLLSMI